MDFKHLTRLIGIILVITSSNLFGQSQVIGRIFDHDSNKTISDVTVKVKGQELETKSNSLGFFQIMADTTNYLILEKHFYEDGLVKVLPGNKMKILLKKRTEAEFEGGLDAFNEYIIQSIKYPPQAVMNKTMGRVYLSFVIDSLGQMTKLRKLKDIGDNCGDAAIETIKNIPNHWIPAETPTTFIIPLIFKFSNSERKYKEIDLPPGKLLDEVVITVLDYRSSTYWETK